MASASEDSDQHGKVPEPYIPTMKESFAYITVKDRWPVILTKVIDTLCRDRHSIASTYGEAAEEETKGVIGQLSELRSEIMTNKDVLQLKSHAEDARIYNDYLTRIASVYNPTWFEAPWLFLECYLYRRIFQSFELSTSLKTYDPFKEQKDSAFLSALGAASTLGRILNKALKEASKSGNEERLLHQWTIHFILISLWGNKYDLSLSAGKEVDDDSGRRNSQLDQLKSDVVDDNTETVWSILKTANIQNKSNVRIDYVLDNAGFELFTDLCFLEFLFTVGLVHRVHIYIKAMPWFVSDVVADDVTSLLQMLANQPDETLVDLSCRWQAKFKNNEWKIETEHFWTHPHDFSEMKDVDPTLYRKLSNSHLIVFKGDLNYRKLTGDLIWKPTTTFEESLRGFLPSSICALRIVKADVVVGLKQGVYEMLEEKQPNWTWVGDYATVQCAVPP